MAAFAVALAMAASACGIGAGVTPGAPPPTTALEPTTTAAIPVPDDPRATSVLPDLSARPLDLDDLEAMLPPGETGPASGIREIVNRGNDDLVAAALLDPDDEERDLTRFGRIAGIGARYPQSSGEAHVWIDLLTGADSAHGYLLDVAGDAAKGYGGSHDPGAGATASDEFPVDGIGDEALGMVLTLAGGDTETAILFRLGRLVAFVSVVRADDADQRVAMQYLGEEVEGRVLAALLQREVVVTTAPRPPQYRFEYDQEIGAGETMWTIRSEGRTHGADISCRVRISGPRVEVDRDLLLIAGRLWQRDHGDPGFVPTGGANLGTRELLSLCPPWPLDAAAAGLADLVSGESASHTVNGVVALGHRADIAGLATAMGTALPGVTIEVFNFWIAEDTPWVVEVDLVAAGPADALRPLLPAAVTASGPVTLNARHRVFDLDTDAGPILPPG